MKRIIRLDEPSELTKYRHSSPKSTWEQMRDDESGRNAYEAVRLQLLEGQMGLCAFCEIDIHGTEPIQCRVEHFHPKSDISTDHNWALDWHNLMAVCMGGSQRHQEPPYALEPLRENLSCDAHKDQMIQTGKLADPPEGWIIDPVTLPAFPCLFFLEKSTGKLLPNAERCAEINVPEINHSSVEALVQNTITMLNLNCTRLCDARKSVVWDIERQKKSFRLKNISPDQALQTLAERYFRRPWPRFFTTIRLCLGAAAEQYLLDTAFQG